jgi:hypothetical protein
MVISSHPGSEKMIFSRQPLHLGVNRRHGPTRPSGVTMTKPQVGHQLDGQEGKGGAGGAGTQSRRPYTVGPVLPAPVVQGLAGAPGKVFLPGPRRAAASTISRRLHSRAEPFLLVLIISLVRMGGCLR